MKASRSKKKLRNRNPSSLDSRQKRLEKFLTALAHSLPISLEKLRNAYCGHRRVLGPITYGDSGGLPE